MDNSNANYIFTDDSDMFDIDNKTGVISFKPSDREKGTHYVIINATDTATNKTFSTMMTIKIEEGKADIESIHIILITLVLIILIVPIIMKFSRSKGSKDEDESFEYETKSSEEDGKKRSTFSGEKKENDDVKKRSTFSAEKKATGLEGSKSNYERKKPKKL